VTHGNANRIALVARDALAGRAPGGDASGDPIAAIYMGRPAWLRELHDRVMKEVKTFGSDVEVAPKRAYVSLRRRKQFAMIQPASNRLDIGLILAAENATDRLELAGSFNAMFTHRVRLEHSADVDAALIGWLKSAYEQAGT
jgi:predicted transport protein